MKLFEEVKSIIESYNLKPIELPEGYKNVYDYIKEHPEENVKFINKNINDDYFLKKYIKRIPKGWYGFSIGHPIIPEWNDIIEKVLDRCIEADPNFEIHQIKTKFGGIRFYCESELIEDLFEIDVYIMNNLIDRKLVY